MIVHCPSCGTRYRHSPAPAETSQNARCGSCEHVFALAPATRAYVLVDRAASGGSSRARMVRGAPTATRPRLGIGMDDPSIAARLGRTALDDHAPGTPAPVLTYRMDAASGPKRAPRTPSTPRSAPEADRRPGLGAALGVLTVTAAGAVAGWWVSPRLIGEPDTWILAGSGVGLIASWLGLRWAHSRS